MILAGLKLSFLGISTVIFFLLILIMFVKLSYRLLSSQSAMELAEIENALLKRQKKLNLAQEGSVLIAIITAAIAAHRTRAGRRLVRPEKCQVDHGPK